MGPECPWTFLLCMTEYKALTVLYLGYFSGSCLQGANLKDVCLSWTRSRLLTACYKMIDLPSSVFLTFNATYCICRHPSQAYCVTLPQPQEGPKQMKMLLLAVLCIIKIFFSDSSFVSSYSIPEAVTG